LKSIPVIWSSFDQYLTDEQYLGLELRPKSISPSQEKLYRAFAQVVKICCDESWMETIPMTAKSGPILRADSSYGYGGYLHLDAESNLTHEMETSIKEIVENLFNYLNEATSHFASLSSQDGSRPGSTPINLTDAISKQFYAIEDRMAFHLVSAIRELGQKDQIEFPYQDAKNISRTIPIPPQSGKPQLEDHEEELLVRVIGLQFQKHQADIEVHTGKSKVNTKLYFDPEHSSILYKVANPNSPETVLKITAKPESYFVNGRRSLRSYQLMSIIKLMETDTKDIFA
jgi:hypothetical protein